MEENCNERDQPALERMEEILVYDCVGGQGQQRNIREGSNDAIYGNTASGGDIIPK